jgi:hypothetical protein
VVPSSALVSRPSGKRAQVDLMEEFGPGARRSFNSVIVLGDRHH